MNAALTASACLMIASAAAGAVAYLRLLPTHPRLAHVALAMIFVGCLETIALAAIADEGPRLRLTLLATNVIGVAAMAALIGRFR